MKKNLFENIVALVVLVFAGLLTGCYAVKVIQYTILWYQVPIHLSFKQIFGTTTIISLILISNRDLRQQSEKIETWDFLSDYFVFATLITMYWGLSYIFQFFI